MTQGVLDRPIGELKFAVLDIETTGLSPGQDRIVELAVVRVDPGEQPKQVLESLVSPGRNVAGTEIHGVTDADVAGAPTFADLASDFLMAISGCVVATYNVCFDLEFLTYELGRVGVTGVPPYLCLMNMQPLLGLGDKCALGAACERFGIPFAARHHAAENAWVAAQLLQRYLERMQKDGVTTFGQLRQKKSFKFLDSLAADPPEWNFVAGNVKPKRRALKPQSLQQPQQSPAMYWDALTAAVSDLQITPEEVTKLAELRRKLNLPDGHTRMFHARLFAAVLRQFLDDQRVDDKEAGKLRRLAECLRQLGWAPGD